MWTRAWTCGARAVASMASGAVLRGCLMCRGERSAVAGSFGQAQHRMLAEHTSVRPAAPVIASGLGWTSKQRVPTAPDPHGRLHSPSLPERVCIRRGSPVAPWLPQVCELRHARQALAELHLTSGKPRPAHSTACAPPQPPLSSSPALVLTQGHRSPCCQGRRRACTHHCCCCCCC